MRTWTTLTSSVRRHSTRQAAPPPSHRLSQAWGTGSGIVLSNSKVHVEVRAHPIDCDRECFPLTRAWLTTLLAALTGLTRPIAADTEHAGMSRGRLASNAGNKLDCRRVLTQHRMARIGSETGSSLNMCRSLTVGLGGRAQTARPKSCPSRAPAFGTTVMAGTAVLSQNVAQCLRKTLRSEGNALWQGQMFAERTYSALVGGKKYTNSICLQ